MKKKILCIMVSVSLIEFIGANSRRFVLKYLFNEDIISLNIRLRSFEIVVSSLLSYFWLKTKIYRHQFITLIIIGISLIIGLIFEFIYIDEKKNVVKGLVVLFSSTITNSVQDIIEKYLLDIDFIDVFKLTTFEGLIDSLICLLFYFMKELRNEVDIILHISHVKLICMIIYLLIYAILCGFNSIYRKYTLIQYSPNIRALAEAIWDPLFIIHSNFIKRPYEFNHSIIILILSIIIDFCACVYNELLVLYCCGMEYDTYIEVNKRGIITKIETDIIGESLSNQEEKEEEDKNLFD